MALILISIHEMFHIQPYISPPQVWSFSSVVFVMTGSRGLSLEVTIFNYVREFTFNMLWTNLGDLDFVKLISNTIYNYLMKIW